MNMKLYNLLRHGAAGAKGFYAPEAKGDTAEIMIYDVIDPYWGIDPQDIINALRQSGAPNLILRINSPGGFVFDGIAIYNAIKNHAAHVTAIVEGVSASIASIITMAADEIVMTKGSMMMIHDPWALVMGDAAAMRKEADLLEKMSGELADIYAARSGVDKATIQAQMKEETWFTAEEAVAAKLADTIDPAKTAQNIPSNMLAFYPKAERVLTEKKAEIKEPVDPEPIKEIPGNRLKALANLRLVNAGE